MNIIAPARNKIPDSAVNMQIINDLRDMQNLSLSWERDKSVGFVPTMGYLHAGHLSLVAKSNLQCDLTVVSIFVNPAQFGPQEDLNTYPRDFEHDLNLLQQYKVDYVFFPSAEMMYPAGYLTWVEVDKLSSVLCGASRPGHFRGVATVIAKLVNLVKPNYMFMGEKDYQQCIVLETMLRDLNFPTEIVRCPIIREPDGLAMSSRNKYLNSDERQKALCLSQALKLAQTLIKEGEKETSVLQKKMSALITQAEGRIDYIAFVDRDTLQPVNAVTDKTRILLAVYIGKTRLIDNCAAV